MTKYILFTTIFFSIIDKCLIKEQIISNLIRDQSLNVFFENKENIYLIDNSDCKYSNDFKHEYQVSVVKGVTDTAISFNKMKIVDDCVNVEIQLFDKNTIYKAEYGVFENDRIILNNSWITQIKQP